jgi:mannose-6-phosphate isomerase-like protein (cupin superfamily)
MMTMTTAVTERDRWFLGSLIRILADGDDTNGQLAVMQQRARRGFSPPLHVHHREDTAMLVLDGRLTAVVGDERVEVGPGGFVWMPRDIPHTFRVDSDEIHHVEFITPAGFERFHIDASDPAASLIIPPPIEPDAPQLRIAAARYDTEVIGPPLGLDD